LHLGGQSVFVGVFRIVLKCLQIPYLCVERVEVVFLNQMLLTSIIPAVL